MQTTQTDETEGEDLVMQRRVRQKAEGFVCFKAVHQIALYSKSHIFHFFNLL